MVPIVSRYLFEYCSFMKSVAGRWTTLFCGSFFNEADNSSNRILLTRIVHCIYELLTVFVQVMNCIQKRCIRKLFFLDYKTESLTFERMCVKNLIATTCTGRKRNQKIRFSKSKQFTDCIRTGTWDNNICKSKEITQFVFDIFKLTVAFDFFQRMINLSFSAEMDDLELFQ